MPLVTERSQAAHRLDHERAAAWETYHSTVCTGGTPEQRAWAFAQALKAEENAHTASIATR